MFAMCSATDSFDIALAAEGVDICEPMFDGDESEANYQSKIDYSKTFAFKDFTLERDPMKYEFSNIDATDLHTKLTQINDFFTLFDFSAKWDVVPTMLTQCHEKIIKGFLKDQAICLLKQWNRFAEVVIFVTTIFSSAHI